MNISQQQISYILSLNKFKKFGKAAADCFVTQPTLSMQIKKVEDNIGYLIFDRSANPLTLTSFGRKLIPILLEMKEQYDKIYHISKMGQGKMITEIKIGIIPTIGNYLVPELFLNKSSFLEGKHLIVKELKSAEILTQLQTKQIDIAILAGSSDLNKFENFRVIPLYNEELLVYVKSNSIENTTESIEVNNLRNLKPWLLSEGNCLRTQMIDFCNLKENSTAEWNYEGGNLEILTKMVDINGGYTIIPKFYQTFFSLESQKVKRFYDHDKNKFLARNIVCFCSDKTFQSIEITEIINFIKKKFANYEMNNYQIIDVQL